LVVADDKAGDEILVLTGRNAVLQPDPHDLVASSLGAIPRTVLGRKAVAAILWGKIAAVVEGQPERRRMRLQQHVRDRHLVLEVGAHADMGRILIGADVEPRPAVEFAFADPRYIVRHQVVTAAVALIGRAPGRSRRRLDRKTDAVADAGGEQLLVLAVGIER